MSVKYTKTKISTICIIMLLLSCSLYAAESDHFVTTWKTDNPGASSDSSITIPVSAAETYNYDVDWNNDNVFDEFGITGSVTHDYGSPNTYTIRIRGTFPRIAFTIPAVDNKKIISINQWGTTAWTSMFAAFVLAENLVNKAPDVPNLSACTNLQAMFSAASQIGSVNDTGNWDWQTGNITNMTLMFNNATSFNKDISSWNTANVSRINNMFNSANNFNQDISNWNFEAVNTSFSNFLLNSAFSTDNYDALLVSWDNQNVQSGLSLNVGTITYCSQTALDARTSLIVNDGWEITDGGRFCDAIFKNSFEAIIVVKTADLQIAYDFSKINVDSLTQKPLLIIKGLDSSGDVDMNIHIRNDMEFIQTRTSYLINSEWIYDHWQDINDTSTQILYW